MERESSRHKLFSRRAAFLVGGKLALLGVIGGRMYYLQVLERDQYQMLAEENRINLRLLPPPRGRILDRFGDELAKNRQNFRVVLIPEQTSDVGKTVRRLGEIVEIQDHQLRRIGRDLKRQRRFMPLTLVENLTWEQFASVNVKLPDLPGVQPDVGETRYYPYGDSLAHVVGYVSAVSEQDLTGDPLLELPGFRIGKNGIEKVYDVGLRGKAGNSRVEVNAYGRVIRELQRQDGQPGDDLVLTIDVGLQQAASRRLAGESASAVVMDVHNGEVLAMVSSPSYDPNAFNLGFSAKSWKALVENPRNPLTNKTIAGQYPPGSTFKMLVALAALESGVITPEHRTFCNGSTKLGRHRFHCWKWRYGGHGWTNLYEAIEQSCDIFFYDIAKKVGVEQIAEMARKFGLGERLDIDLVGQRAGLVPNKAWKLATTGVPWQTGETLITGIGQGYLLTTPLQLAVMTARLSNGGFAVQPRLVRDKAAASTGEFAEPPTSPPSLGISSSSLNAVLKGMRMVVHGRHGTARGARLEDGVKMAGKTGTAQVRRITKAERASGVRKAEEKPWEERAHGLFVAYAPADRPRYALSLVIEHGGSGAKAALVARDIMAEVLARDPLRRPAIGRLASRPPADGQG